MAKVKGLYKRGNMWWLRYAGLDGKMKFESSNSNSFKLAQDLLIKKKNDIMEGKEPSPAKRMAKHLFRELAENYMKWAERQRAYRSKRLAIMQLVSAFGNYPLRSFATRIIEEWQTQRLAVNKPATVNRLLATLKHMFTKAVEWEMVEEEALKKVRKVKLLPEHNRRLRFLSKEECQALINASSSHLRPIVITALNTGMRKEEILSLKWDKHVDLKHRFILLEDSKNGEPREIPINQALRETLQGIIRRIDSPYVFVDANGKRFKDVKRSFNSALRRAGIKDFHFHDLRHTFASHLVMAGTDITTVKELLGHKTLTMTLRYAHLAQSHKVKAMEALGEAISGRPTIQKVYNSMQREVAGVC